MCFTAAWIDHYPHDDPDGTGRGYVPMNSSQICRLVDGDRGWRQAEGKQEKVVSRNGDFGK